MKGTQSIVLGAMVVTIVNATVDNLAKNDSRSPAIRIWIGGYIITVVLLAVSDAKPQVAESIALLIMLSSLVGPTGDTLINMVTRLTKPDAKLKPSPSTYISGTNANRNGGYPTPNTPAPTIPGTSANRGGGT